MVKIPELAEDGQNWKIYRAKFLKVAATFDCLEVLAGRPYEGDDWDGCNALLCYMFMETVAPSIYFKIHRRTAHKIFKYLAKRFRDSEPIPCANEFQRAGTATAAETPDNCPTSADAATERHAHAEWNTEDLSTTQDVDNGNVRRMEDPRTSFEASAQGTSANCAETTLVVLESMPHETQDQPHSSLPLTPRPPIEGEPGRCKQEVADSVTTAGRMNGMAEMAKPTDADVDSEKAPLGGDPAERACRVDEGDGTEREPQLRLQEIKLLCGEIDQRSGNANETVPIANGLPLKGEWIVCASSEIGCERSMDGRACVDKAEEANQVPTECCQQLGTADGDPSQEIEPAGIPNETDTLVVVSVELYVEDGDADARICLGATRWRSCDVEGLGGRADGSTGQTDASSASNRPETVVVSHSNSAGTYLGVRDAKHAVLETDGARIHADTSTGHGDVPNVDTYAIKPTNETGNVRTCRIRWKTENSPNATEIATAKPASRWRRVGVGDVNVHLPWNAPVEALGRTFEFRRLKRAGEAIAPSVEGKTARDDDGDGDPNGGDGDSGDGDGTASGNGVDSSRVKAVRLAEESQHMRRSRRK